MNGTTPPKIFKRGGDLSVVMSLPSYVETGHFSDWTPTVQLRRFQNDTPKGFIADLTFAWLDQAEARAFRITGNNTDNWPLGLAELDVLFTSPLGKKVNTQTVVIKIDRGISRGAA